jgi:hypothetical protein
MIALNSHVILHQKKNAHPVAVDPDFFFCVQYCCRSVSDVTTKEKKKTSLPLLRNEREVQSDESSLKRAADL